MANDPMRNAGLLAASVICVAGFAGYAHAQTTFLEEGFTLEVVTDDVPLARQIAEAPDGTLFVGSSSRCDHGPVASVYAVVQRDDGDAEVVRSCRRFLRCPSGVALRGDDLYVAARDRVLRYPDIMDTFRNEPAPEVITDDLPDDNSHGWKYLVFGPDGYLYVPVGAPCNVCDESDERFATILRMDPDSGETTVYAHGVRNSVGMAWHPVTRQLWFSENGRDWSGDDLPADEINRVQTPGGHYGFPYFHQDHRPDAKSVDFEDPGFGAGKNARRLPAFGTPDPGALRRAGGHLLQRRPVPVALLRGDVHCRARLLEPVTEGSATQVSCAPLCGPRCAKGRSRRLRVLCGLVERPDPNARSGRPNDVVVSRDGTLLIADDDPAGNSQGAVYRVRYTPPGRRHDIHRMRRHRPHLDLRAQEP